jgi:hypothetical protein
VIDARLNSVEAELDDSCSDEFDGKKIVFRGCESEDSKLNNGEGTNCGRVVPWKKSAELQNWFKKSIVESPSRNFCKSLASISRSVSRSAKEGTSQRSEKGILGLAKISTPLFADSNGAGTIGSVAIEPEDETAVL